MHHNNFAGETMIFPPSQIDKDSTKEGRKMVSTRRSENTTATAEMIDKKPGKRDASEDVEATPSAAAAAARPRRTRRKTAGVHTRDGGTTATTTKTGKRPPRAPAAVSAAAHRSTACKSKKKKVTAVTPVPSSRTSSATSQTGRARRINYHDPKSFPNALDWDYARCDPSVARYSLAKAYKLDGEKRKGMVDNIEPNSPAMKSAGGAWDRFRKDPSTEGPARLRVEADLRAKAAAGVLFENLDPVRRTAVEALGGPEVFGFGTAAAASGATVVVAPAPGPSAAATTADVGADATPAWWRQAYAEQQEKNRELQAQQTKDRAELQAQLMNSNLIQQQMLAQLDQHRTAIGGLQNGQQRQGAAIVDG